MDGLLASNLSMLAHPLPTHPPSHPPAHPHPPVGQTQALRALTASVSDIPGLVLGFDGVDGVDAPDGPTPNGRSGSGRGRRRAGGDEPGGGTGGDMPAAAASASTRLAFEVEGPPQAVSPEDVTLTAPDEGREEGESAAGAPPSPRASAAAPPPSPRASAGVRFSPRVVAPDHAALLNADGEEGDEADEEGEGEEEDLERGVGSEVRLEGSSSAADDSQGSTRGSRGRPGSVGKARFLPAALLVFR